MEDLWWILELMRHSKSRFIENARRVGTGAVRKLHVPFSRLVGAVSNCAYAVRLETAPTGGRKCLFIFRIHQDWLEGIRHKAWKRRFSLNFAGHNGRYRQTFAAH